MATSRFSASPSRIATTQEQSADSSGWPIPRSVAMDSAAISSARRTPESAAGARIVPSCIRRIVAGGATAISDTGGTAQEPFAQFGQALA